MNTPTRVYPYQLTAEEADRKHLLRIDGKEVVMTGQQFRELVERGHVEPAPVEAPEPE